MNEIIIIPDVHGRTFWKESIKGNEDKDIIFLGDYLDPYPYEHISSQDAIDNFLEIIEFKKKHNDNVTLLLGNHDFMFYIFSGMGYCRTDFANAPLISKIFEDNFNLFKLATYREFENVNISFSHAPIIRNWVENIDVEDKDNLKEVIEKLNYMLMSEKSKLSNLLGIVGRARGGYDRYGSCVWADVSEIVSQDEDELYENWYQVFGHTQLRDEAIIMSRFADLDCRKGFILVNDSGKININPIKN